MMSLRATDCSTTCCPNLPSPPAYPYPSGQAENLTTIPHSWSREQVERSSGFSSASSSSSVQGGASEPSFYVNRQLGNSSDGEDVDDPEESMAEQASSLAEPSNHRLTASSGTEWLRFFRLISSGSSHRQLQLFVLLLFVNGAHDRSRDPQIGNP
ncbi:unnamed protein product, partial [Dibothriocephalus latus]